MTLAIRAALLLLLIIISAIGSGLAIVRRLRWDPLEMLVASTGVSWVIVYLCGFALFVADAPTAVYWAVSAAMAVLTLSQWRLIRRLLRNRIVRLALGAYLLLIAWGWLLLCVMRNYSGGFWTGDWAEQFQRMLLFMHRLPTDFWFQGIMQLPARTPMLSVIAAFYCRQVGVAADGRVSFELFSLVFLILNAWAALPCCLVYRWWLAGRRTRFSSQTIGLFVALLVLNPMLAENLTWTWTKLLAAGYVVLGVYLYLRAGRKADRRSGQFVVASFFFLTAGALVHLTAAAAAVFVGLHYLLTRFVAVGRTRWRELSLIAAVVLLLSASWFGWSIAHFGVHRTFSSYADAPVGPVEQHTPTPARIGHNLFYTLVPHPPAFARLAEWYGGDSPLVRWRDYTFELYQSCLLLMLGCVGGVVTLGVLLAMLRRHRGQQSFWIGFIALFLILSCASTSRLEEFGVGMLCQPLALFGLVLLASRLPILPAAIRLAAIVGCAIDFVVGIVLHLWLQHHVFAFVIEGREMVLKHSGFNDAAAANFYAKTALGLSFWGDAANALMPLPLVLMAAAGVAALGVLAWATLWPNSAAHDVAASAR